LSDALRIEDVAVSTIRVPMPEPIRFGDWVIEHREYALVRVRSADGECGVAYGFTRDAPVAEAVRRAVAPSYLGVTVEGRAGVERLFAGCRASNLASLGTGIGLRALSLVDLALHDLVARAGGLPIVRYLGGTPRALPATAVVGYPPALTGPDEVHEQVIELRRQGWRRFKLPIVHPLELARDRLVAAREAAGADAWLCVDGAWLFRSAGDVLAFLETAREAALDSIEDMVPPGDATLLAMIRERVGDLDVAMGDEQGGGHFPDALLRPPVVTTLRIDLTCMGGLTQAPALLAACRRAGVRPSPHIFGHVHSQAMAGLGEDAPIEWGIPGTGVDQFADSLTAPVIRDGLMEPFAEEPGFGRLVAAEWLAEQEVLL
jgi:L-alanine-DL-glutamate epimerase-like enolase superfamily enzyme